MGIIGKIQRWWFKRLDKHQKEADNMTIGSLLKEYNLIQQKASKLNANQRKAIVERVESVKKSK